MRTYEDRVAAADSERRERISEATAFDAGELFASPAEVREYFALANMTEMFGADWIDGGREWDQPAPLWTQGEPWTQNDLDGWADLVIDGGWHCAFAPMTTAEAAEALGINPATVRQAIADGRLNAVRFGRDWQLNPAEVERYKRERRLIGELARTPGRQDLGGVPVVVDFVEVQDIGGDEVAPGHKAAHCPPRAGACQTARINPPRPVESRAAAGECRADRAGAGTIDGRRPGARYNAGYDYATSTSQCARSQGLAGDPARAAQAGARGGAGAVHSSPVGAASWPAIEIENPDQGASEINGARRVGGRRHWLRSSRIGCHPHAPWPADRATTGGAPRLARLAAGFCENCLLTSRRFWCILGTDQITKAGRVGACDAAAALTSQTASGGPNG